MRTRTAFSGVTVLGVLVALLWMPTAAQADLTGAGGDPSGYKVSVAINFTGNGVPGGSETHSVSVHPSCWWQPADGDYKNMKAMLAWYLGVTGPAGATTAGEIAEFGPLTAWQDAVTQEKAGAHLAWYLAHCDNPNDYTKFGISAQEGTDPVNGNGQNWQTYLYHAFVDGEPIPEPLVPTAELARAADNELVIPDPEVNWNPKVGADASTLVGLPTWFWVREAAFLGDGNGELTVKASLDAHPDVWAKVVARTADDALTIHSAYGGNTCTRAEALVAYAGNPSAAGACTVTFSHSGPVSSVQATASTHWTASWTGSDGDGGGLDDKFGHANAAVSVIEVQNIVTR